MVVGIVAGTVEGVQTIQETHRQVGIILGGGGAREKNKTGGGGGAI